MQHNHHNPDATWETKLVIPEAVKSVEERTLDVLLEISASLEKLRVDFLRTRREQMVEEAVAKTLDDAHTSEELQLYNETTAPKAKAKRK